MFGIKNVNFDHLRFIPVIKRMYLSNSVDEIKNYASFSQVERFRKELETLKEFGLHKDLDIDITSDRYNGATSLKMSDGKADVIFSVSNAIIKETYIDNRNIKRYKRKIKNAFINTTAYRNNQAMANDVNPPHNCLNCGAPLKAESENYFCPYCHSEYKAETYEYLFTRFFIEGALRDLHYTLFIFIPILILAILQASNIISEHQMGIFSIALGTIFALIVIFAIAMGIGAFLRHQSILKKIRKHDPNFSREIFTMRLMDLVTEQPERLLSSKKNEEEAKGVICNNIQPIQLLNYERKDDFEIVTCKGDLDALYLTGNQKKVKIKEKRKKFKMSMARKYGTLTQSHYIPDQFTCPNCGGHQISKTDGVQVCDYCQSKIAMEEIDWVLFSIDNKG